MSSVEGVSPLKRREAGWALLFLAVGLLGYGRVVFLDAALFGRDTLHHYWPMRESIRRSLLEGQLPQWDPSQQSGLPVLGNIHTGVFYPPNLLFLPLSFPRAYAVLLWLHQALFGMGLYLWARRQVGVAPALVAALAAMLSGLVLSLNNYGPMMSGIAWVPWVLFAWTSPAHAPRRAAAVAALLALQACSGDPMSTIYSGLLLGIEVAWPTERRGRALPWLATAVVAAVLLAAVQLVPGLYAWTQSSRQAGEGGFGLQWSMHPLRLVEMLLPNPFGFFLEQPYFWPHFLGSQIGTTPFMLSLYSGVVVLMLALQGVRRDRLTLQALAMVAVGLALALGSRGPAALLLSAVPPFSFFHFPEKYWLLATIGLALLAANGAARVGQGEVSLPRLLGPPVLGLLTVLTAGWVGPAVVHAMRQPDAEAIVPLDLAGQHTFVFAALVTGVLWLRKKIAPARTVWILIAALIIDLSTGNDQVVWTAPLELYATPSPLAEELPRRSPQQPFRFWRDSRQLEQRSNGSYEGAVLRRAWDVASLKSNVGSIFGLEELSGLSPVVLADWETIALSLYPQRSKLFALFNTCMGVALPDNKGFVSDPGFDAPVQLESGIALYPVRRCGQRVHGVKALIEVSDVNGALATLKGNFEPFEQATVQGHPAAQFESSTSVTDLVAEAHRLRATVSGPGPGFLVFATSWYPGWRVFLDGVEVPAFRSNGAQFGIDLPAGEHRVEARFRDPGLSPGLVLTAAGALLVLALWRRGRSSALTV